MSLPINRREMLGVVGVAGAVTTSAMAPGRPARADHVELGRFVRREGVRGKMTGAQAVAAALACEGVPCVFGVPGRRTTSSGTRLKARGVPYFLVANEGSASVMADASARATGAVGVVRRRAGAGAHQRDDRHRRGAL